MYLFFYILLRTTEQTDFNAPNERKQQGYKALIADL